VSILTHDTGHTGYVAGVCQNDERRSQTVFGIPLIDVPFINARYARSALPKAPVLGDERKRRVRGGPTRRTALGSRHG
jgi:hypothetical protein